MTKRVYIQRVLVLLTAILILPFSMSSSNQVLAYEGRSENRKIDWGNLNSFAGRKTSETYYLVDTGGQLGVELFTSENYKIYAGFGYFYSLIPFTFTIDSGQEFNFPSLEANTPQIATTDLTVTSGAAHGYVVTVHQDHPLSLGSSPNHVIPDVTGDNNDITHLQEGLWALNTTYGFGYTLQNLIGTDAVFTTGYKQFADLSNLEQPQAIMENKEVTRTSSVRVEYKLNIGHLQGAGFYKNKISYRCTGTF